MMYLSILLVLLLYRFLPMLATLVKIYIITIPYTKWSESVFYQGITIWYLATYMQDCLTTCAGRQDQITA